MSRPADLETERLRDFARDVMSAWPHGDLDGGDLQDAAIKHGLLQPEQRTDRCGEVCYCADCLLPDEMAAGFTCYRRVEWLRAAIFKGEESK